MKTPGRSFSNPYRPGAGHMPPYLAGRRDEIEEFQRLLDQDVILDNLVLTGLRGVGKTVLLETFKPLAMAKGWAWVGADLSESASISEELISTRILTDLAVLTSMLPVDRQVLPGVGFGPSQVVERTLDYSILVDVYDQTPGLSSDKLKAVLELSWACLKVQQTQGLVFAYDEAQNLSDHAAKDQYPLSLMLDVFQSIQKKGVPFLLVLTGLPTLFPKLVEARTFSERMFRVLFLDRLDDRDSRQALTRPVEDSKCPVKMTKEMIDRTVELSGGYPYFIQFLGREVYDIVLRLDDGRTSFTVSYDDIVRKLDTDFFAGRWTRTTDRQRDILSVISELENADSEFSVQEVTELSHSLLDKPFSPSHANQMLAKLSDMGLVYKNRHGRYMFAVPLMGRFIRRLKSRSDRKKHDP